MTTIGMLIFDDAEELDWVGPWEVFTASAQARADGGGAAGPRGHHRRGRPAHPLRQGPPGAAGPHLDDHPPLDVALVPGGWDRREATNRGWLDWLAKQAATAQWMTSVCTGSLLLHASGVAEGRRLATHWAFEDALEAQGATVVRDARFVRANVVSSQGVSAGIDNFFRARPSPRAARSAARTPRPSAPRPGCP